MEELGKILAGIANKNISINEGDYIENGLLHCGKCHKPKQTIINFGSGDMKVRVICDCEKAKLEQEEEEQRQRERRQRAEERRKLGFTDPTMKEFTFENADNSPAVNIGKNYVENFKTFKKSGKGLLLYGSVGTGKTYLACCIANALIDVGHTAMVTNISRLVNSLQSDVYAKQSRLDNLKEFDLLVLDDFGVERKTEYMQETVYNIIDTRCRSGLPMIITTNIGIEEFKRPASTADARLYDRILMLCHPVEVSGTNKRREKIRNDYEETCKLLGIK